MLDVRAAVHCCSAKVVECALARLQSCNSWAHACFLCTLKLQAWKCDPVPALLMLSILCSATLGCLCGCSLSSKCSAVQRRIDRQPDAFGLKHTST